MKSTFALILILTGFVLAAQTKVIAHKSHSGHMHTLIKNTEDNFGLNPDHQILKVDSVQRVSPAMILLYKQAYGDQGVLKDSVFLNTNPNNIVAVLDSLKKVYPSAKFIGFDTSVRTKKKNKSEIVLIIPDQFPSSGMPLFISILLTGTILLGWHLHRTQLAQLKTNVA
jgi:hypothetical protein